MTSKSIYFTPTYLYIKFHSVTGKFYFGKTIKNPEIYHGSGKHWASHIKVHGKEFVETLWFCLFLDKESIQEFALNFSKEQNIVESKEWLNLKPENGLDGQTPGISSGMLGRKTSIETKSLQSESHKGKVKSSSHLSNISKALKGISTKDSYVLTPARKEANSKNASIATKAAALANIGKFWWNNGITEMKSKTIPGDGFHRGRKAKI